VVGRHMSAITFTVIFSRYYMTVIRCWVRLVGSSANPLVSISTDGISVA